MKHIYLIGLLLSLPFFGFSQGEWNNWYFGEWAAISFNSGTPQFQAGSQMSAIRACASVSDSLGNLLFYTDGHSVYDRTNSIMPNGTGLLAQNQDQSVFVVHNISDLNLYYIFTLNCRNCWPPPNPGLGLHYSVIDMRLNGGSGDIVASQKNIMLLDSTHYPISMTATRSHNNKDVWLIVRNSNSDNTFYAFQITSGGIQQPPVISPSSVIVDPASSAGYMRVSPDGNYLASPFDVDVQTSKKGFEFCRFNSATGQITPLFTCTGLDSIHNSAWNYLEFSIDSKYLYNSTRDWENSYILQYDATLEDSVLFRQSKTLVGYSLHGVHLQMGTDWKIYGDESPIDSMCVINNPTIGGVGCNFQANAIYLNQKVCLQGIPQFLQKYYAYIHHPAIPCSLSPVNFTSSIWPPADSIHWDFGDPLSGTANYSNLPDPIHQYADTGTYTVELFVRHIDKRTDTSWQTIRIWTNPLVALGSDRTICTGDSVTFDAGACSGCTYLWKDLGSGLTVGTFQTFKTGLAGIYSVYVTNPGGCMGADTVQLMTSAVPSVTNNPLSKTICSGESTNIALTSSVSSTIFHWTASLTSGNITGFSADSGTVVNQVLSNPDPTAGNVMYHITPENGSCVGTAVDFQVTVNPGVPVNLSISASGNPICTGDPVTITAISSNEGAHPAYQWFVNGKGAGADTSVYTYIPGDGDHVICNLTSGLQCVINREASDSIVIRTINPLKIIDTTLCYGTPYFAQGEWHTTGGIFHDSLVPPVSCIRFIETHLSYKPSIPVNLGNDTLLCGNTITLNAFLTGGTYLWQDGSTGSKYIVAQAGEYWVMVSYEGCVKSDSISIGECPLTVSFPTAFTPNGDGLNDTFHPIGSGIEKFSMQIFNRWGTMVFETSSPETGWDGTYKGSLCPDDTYVFKASYQIYGEANQATGTITLQR